MGIENIWSDILRFCISIKKYSNAVGQVNKYKKILEKLDDNIPKCEEQLEAARNDGSKLHEQYLINGGSAVGEAMDYFVNKESVWNEMKDQVLGNMETALSTAKERRITVENMLEDWEGQVAKEEKNLRTRVRRARENERKGD